MAKIVRIISLNRNPRLNEFGPTDLVLNSKTGELFSKANNQLIRVIARNVSNLKPPTNDEIQNIKPESRLNRGLSNEDVLNNLTSDNINTLKQGKSITNSTISEDISYSQFLRPEAVFSDSDTSTYTKYTIPGRIGTFVSGTLFFDLNQSSSNNYIALGTTNTQLRLTGNTTSSGNISASGTIVGSNLSGTNTGDQDLSNLAITGSSVLFTNISSSGNISASGEVSANTIVVSSTISHIGDSDTRILFTDDDINITVGGMNMVDFSEGSTDEITFNETAQDLDVRIEGEDDPNLLFTMASTPGRVGIGTNTPPEKLTVQGNISASGQIIGTIDGGSF